MKRLPKKWILKKKIVMNLPYCNVCRPMFFFIPQKHVVGVKVSLQ